MARFKATPQGSIPFTVAEESQADIAQIAFEADEAVRAAGATRRQEDQDDEDVRSQIKKIEQDVLSDLITWAARQPTAPRSVKDAKIAIDTRKANLNVL